MAESTELTLSYHQIDGEPTVAGAELVAQAVVDSMDAMVDAVRDGDTLAMAMHAGYGVMRILCLLDDFGLGASIETAVWHASLEQRDDIFQYSKISVGDIIKQSGTCFGDMPVFIPGEEAM